MWRYRINQRLISTCNFTFKCRQVRNNTWKWFITKKGKKIPYLPRFVIFIGWKMFPWVFKFFSISQYSTGFWAYEVTFASYLAIALEWIFLSDITGRPPSVRVFLLRSENRSLYSMEEIQINITAATIYFKTQIWVKMFKRNDNL